MKPRTIIILLATVAILSLFYWATFRWLVLSWLSNSYYSHGFLVPIVSGFFIWIKRSELKTRDPSMLGLIFLALGASVYIVAQVWDIRALAAFSLLIVLGSFSLLFFGVRATRSLLFPLCFLVFMIPPPFIQETGFFLQRVSISSSTWLLHSFGLPVSTIGPEIHLGDTVFYVGLPCSGINTLIALLALAAVYAYLLSGHISKRAILFVLAFPVAMLANILRITSIILVANYGEVGTATGWFHDLSSPLFFILAFLFLILIGRIMGCKLSFTSLGR